jgi:hypothetical protein
MAGLVNLDLLLVVDNVLLVVIALALYGQAMFPGLSGTQATITWQVVAPTKPGQPGTAHPGTDPVDRGNAALARSPPGPHSMVARWTGALLARWGPAPYQSWPQAMQTQALSAAISAGGNSGCGLR